MNPGYHRVTITGGLILLILMPIWNFGGDSEDILKDFEGVPGNPEIILKWDPAIRRGNFDKLFSHSLVLADRKNYDAVPISGGRYLVNIIRSRAVRTIGKNGEDLGEMPVGGYPCSLQRLENGNLLVAGWDDQVPGFVKEFDAGGRVVWEMKNLRWPWKAQRLANQNTLIADAGTNCVFEVDPQGRTVWTVENLGPQKPELFDALGPVYCQRLDDGNTLVSIRGLSRVVEVNPAGDVVWQVGKESVLNQYSAIRLWNGNTLIADGGHFRVIEVDYDGQIVWEKKGFGYPAKAYRY